MLLTSRARAKINLTLHVLRRQSDGWHEIESLVAFAGLADHLVFAPAEQLALTIAGPSQAGLGPADDNLVLRAVRQLGERVERLRVGRFHLTKILPVASGIGGGSADAAAALRLLAAANDIARDDPRLLEAAAATGSDVPVCLDAKARMMGGRGERLGPLLDLAPLFAVLVNPGLPLETKAVFARMGLSPGEALGLGRHPAIVGGMERKQLLQALGRARNDLEDAASVLLPVIGHQVAVLSAARGCRLARMSGSGATCYGLFDDRRAAAAAAAVIRRDHPEWWVHATTLR